MSEFIKQLKDLGEEFIETLKYKIKFSTFFDLYTEKVFPSFVSEKDLKEYYEKRMEEVNDLSIYFNNLNILYKLGCFIKQKNYERFSFFFKYEIYLYKRGYFSFNIQRSLIQWSLKNIKF